MLEALTVDSATTQNNRCLQSWGSYQPLHASPSALGCGPDYLGYGYVMNCKELTVQWICVSISAIVPKICKTQVPPLLPNLVQMFPCKKSTQLKNISIEFFSPINI